MHDRRRSRRKEPFPRHRSRTSPRRASLPSSTRWTRFARRRPPSSGSTTSSIPWKRRWNRPEFDAVVITTPTPTHLPLTATAASAQEARLPRKADGAEPSGMRCHHRRGRARRACCCSWASCAVSIRSSWRRPHRIEAGEIGQPMMIKSNTHGPGLPPAWARDLRTSNGMLAEVNSHDWDTTRWLMGSDYTRVYTEVANFKGAANGVETANFYDNALVNLKFESGGLGIDLRRLPVRLRVRRARGDHRREGHHADRIAAGPGCGRLHRPRPRLVTPIFRTWPERFEWGYINELQHFVTLHPGRRRHRVSAAPKDAGPSPACWPAPSPSLKSAPCT